MINIKSISLSTSEHHSHWHKAKVPIIKSFRQSEHIQGTCRLAFSRLLPQIIKREHDLRQEQESVEYSLLPE